MSTISRLLVSVSGRVAVLIEALQSVWTGIMERGGQWVLDVDVRKYFDSIDQVKLESF